MAVTFHRFVIIVTCLTITVDRGLGQDMVEYTESFSPNPSYTVRWCTESADSVRFQLTSDGEGWLAVGFSNDQTMPNTDVVMLTGEGEFQDAFADRRAAPIPDAAQDVTLISSSQAEGATTVEFSRPISSGDATSDLSLDEERFLLWAFQGNSDSFRTRHSQRGFSSERFNFSEAASCNAGAVFNDDFTGDGMLDVADINALLGQVASGTHPSEFDVNGDLLVDSADISDYLEASFNSFVGDSNLDGEFNSSDIVSVFVAGQYEDGVAMNSMWEQGDWNGSADFGTDDLVFAFQEGGFEQGPRPSAAVVPEPLSLNILWSIGLFFIASRRGTTNS